MERMIFAFRCSDAEMARLLWLADHWGLSLGATIQQAIDAAYSQESGLVVEPAPGRRPTKGGKNANGQ